MPEICPIFSKTCCSKQNQIECSTCHCWIHHGNRLNCSGLTDCEFSLHLNDSSKFFECDNCISGDTLKTFSHLPQFDLPTFDSNNPVNIFTSAKVNHKEFISNCSRIEDFLNISDHVVDDVLSVVNSKYYGVDEFNSLKFDVPSSFKLCHVNIASLDCHIDDLRLVLSRLKYKFDIIGISEHKINSYASNNIDLDGYNPFIFEPTETTHGGTGFYIRDNINFIERSDIELTSPGNFESKFIEIKFENKNLVIGCIYRHPNSQISVPNFCEEHLDPILIKIANDNKQCILMGDFNVNLLKSDSDTAISLFYNTLTSHHYSPFVLQPTRLRSKTLIDNIVFNSLEYDSKSGNLLIEISDHLIQFLVLEGFVKASKPPKIDLFKRDFKNFNEREFNEEVINKVDWNNVCKLNQKNPDISCKNFYDTLNFHLDEYAPYRKVTKKELELMQNPGLHLIFYINVNIEMIFSSLLLRKQIKQK